MYSGLGRSVMADLGGQGRIKTRYITLGGGQLLARIDTSSDEPFYYHFDALGSTVAASDEKGRVVTRMPRVTLMVLVVRIPQRMTAMDSWPTNG